MHNPCRIHMTSMQNSITFAANDNKGNVVLRNNNPAKLSLGARMSNFFTGRNSVSIEGEILNLSKNERAAIDAIFNDEIINAIAKETNKVLLSGYYNSPKA